MGMFLRVATAVLICILISGQAIQCFRNGTSATKSKNRKIKRDSSNSKFSYRSNSLFDDVNSFGHQQHYSSSPPAPGRGNTNKFAPLFNFPMGTKFTLTPAVSIPISLEQLDDLADINTKLEASFPITVKFKDQPMRGLFPISDPFDDRISSWNIPETFEDLRQKPSENSERKQQEQRLLSRKLRDVGSIRSNTTMRQLGIDNGEPSLKAGQLCPSKSFSDRRTILQKVELFVSSFIGPNDNPKSCLLRWACEMHENSVVAGYYGLLGEGALLAFSVEQLSRDCDTASPNLSYLLPFIKAEIAGKSGNCISYAKKCSQSLFVK